MGYVGGQVTMVWRTDCVSPAGGVRGSATTEATIPALAEETGQPEHSG
jgi:hypothetical protein